MNRRLAAVDVGSNTVHLLIATVSEQGVSNRRHAVRLLGLGRKVRAEGSLGDQVLHETAELVLEMVRAAREDGAEQIGLVATEAVRMARDGALLGQAVQRLCGERLRILSGEQEARLSYLGATAFRVPADQRAMVVDVGGASTEVVQGHGTKPRGGISLKIGSDRVLETTKAADPPTERQGLDASARIAMVLELAPAASGPINLIATGGTAANVPALLGTRPAVSERGGGLRAESDDPWTELSREQVENALVLVSHHSSAEISRRTGLSPERSRLMAGGVPILHGMLDHYRLDQLLVTERGLRDGVLLAIRGDRTPAPGEASS